jgi:hypothetical protein
MLDKGHKKFIGKNIASLTNDVEKTEYPHVED